MMKDLSLLLWQLNRIEGLAGKIKYLAKAIIEEKDEKTKKVLIKMLFDLTKKSGKRFSFEDLFKNKVLVTWPEILATDTSPVDEVAAGSTTTNLPSEEEVVVNEVKLTLADKLALKPKEYKTLLETLSKFGEPSKEEFNFDFDYIKSEDKVIYTPRTESYTINYKKKYPLY